MIFHLPVALAATLSFFTVAFAGPSGNSGRLCANNPTDEEVATKEGRFAGALNNTGTPTKISTGSRFCNHTIKVYFNVIYANETLEQGYVP